MEDILNNDTQTEKVKEQLPTRNRSVLSMFLSAATKVQYIIPPNKNGDMSFAVDLNDMGFSPNTFRKYANEIYSNFVVDLMGELLIRDNLPMFVPYITGMETKNYLSAVGYCTHVRFGMKSEKDKMIFSFHLSLLQGILTEDFKNE